MTIRRLATLIAAVLLTGAALMPTPARAAPESFSVMVGSFGFSTVNARNQAQTRITNFMGSKRQFRDETLDFNRIASGKYGGVAGLGVTIRFTGTDARTDADALWVLLEAQAWNVLADGSQAFQSDVTFDSETGTQTVTEIHLRNWPAQPTDF